MRFPASPPVSRERIGNRGITVLQTGLLNRLGVTLKIICQKSHGSYRTEFILQFSLGSVFLGYEYSREKKHKEKMFHRITANFPIKDSLLPVPFSWT